MKILEKIKNALIQMKSDKVPPYSFHAYIYHNDILDLVAAIEKLEKENIDLKYEVRLLKAEKL